MNNDIKTSKNLLTGLFIVSLCLALFVFALHSGVGYAKGSRPFFVVFDDVSGLATANKVRVDGINVGFVSALEIDESMRARVRVEIKNEVEIRQGALAQLRTKTFLGGRFIEIKPGDRTARALKAGSEIPTDISPVTPDQLSAFFTRSFPKQGNLFEQFSATLDSVDMVSEQKDKLFLLKDKTSLLFQRFDKLKSWYLKSKRISNKLSSIDLEKIPELITRAEVLEKRVDNLVEKLSASLEQMDGNVELQSRALLEKLTRLSKIIKQATSGQSDLLRKIDMVLLHLLIFDEGAIRKIFQDEGVNALLDASSVKARIRKLENEQTEVKEN